MLNPAPQLPLFATEPGLTPTERRALERLRKLRVDETTPLAALNALAELQRLLEGE